MIQLQISSEVHANQWFAANKLQLNKDKIKLHFFTTNVFLQNGDYQDFVSLNNLKCFRIKFFLTIIKHIIV